jgi:hypothetical protein
MPFAKDMAHRETRDNISTSQKSVQKQGSAPEGSAGRPARGQCAAGASATSWRTQKTGFDMAATVAVVLGGSYGIGEGISKRMAKDGHIVIVGTRDEAAGRAVVEQINKDGGKGEWKHCDIAEPANVEALFDEV